MPYVLEFNRSAIDDKLTRLAAWLELPDPSFKAVMSWVLALRKRIGIPHTLKDIGVGSDRIEISTLHGMTVRGTSTAAVTSSLQRARATLARQSGPRAPGDIDADQLARYQDAFRRYDIAALVGIIRVEAGQAAG